MEILDSERDDRGYCTGIHFLSAQSHHMSYCWGVTMSTAMALCRLERCTGFVGLVDDVIASGKESNIWKPTRLERTPGREPLNPERELGLASHVKTLTMQNTGRRITS